MTERQGRLAFGYRLLAVAGAQVAVTIVLAGDPVGVLPWVALYLVPIYVAAYWFGLTGAYATALLSGVELGFFLVFASPVAARFHAVAAEPDRYAGPAGATAVVVIAGALLVGRLADEKRRDSTVLMGQASTDPLTALPNRRRLEEHLDQELARSARYASPFAVLLLDVDHFKRFNDTYGHQAGDQALREVSRAIERAIRDFDMAGRYGGEEFAVVLAQTDPEEALVVAERIRARVAQRRISMNKWDSARVSVSIGVACFPEDSEDGDTLIANADRALYDAKRSGRNLVRRWRPNLEFRGEGSPEEVEQRPDDPRDRQTGMRVNPVDGLSAAGQ
jgi:diguanylate cyclase (GGDEF)-like protein